MVQTRMMVTWFLVVLVLSPRLPKLANSAPPPKHRKLRPAEHEHGSAKAVGSAHSPRCCRGAWSGFCVARVLERDAGMYGACWSFLIETYGGNGNSSSIQTALQSHAKTLRRMPHAPCSVINCALQGAPWLAAVGKGLGCGAGISPPALIVTRNTAAGAAPWLLFPRTNVVGCLFHGQMSLPAV